jgi:membrane-bound lytic murein transglycosylase D
LRTGLAALPADQRVTWQRYRIRRGDSLIRIARQFDTEVALLREVNNLRGNLHRAGATLMIPDSRAWQDSLALAGGGASTIRRVTPCERAIPCIKIARRFDVTIDELVDWNELNPSHYLQPGQSLTLYLAGALSRGRRPVRGAR